MSEEILIGLVSIVVLGMVAQWLAWRLRLPAILLLLLFGFLAGPVTQILNPGEIFGAMLYPIISLSVALILFEGSLQLKFRELREAGPLVARLTVPGLVLTWILAAAAAHYAAALPWTTAVLLGAVLVVTGPTVIIPLLRQVRPTKKLASAIKWEGIVNDPIGAILAVLTFEVIIAGDARISMILASGAAKALLMGLIAGLAGAAAIVVMLRRYLAPDYLLSPISMMMVVLVFAAANAVQSESGLLAVTIMGVALANQRYVSIRAISEFKENLQVILIASLFIILAAHLPVGNLQLANAGEWIFIGLLIVVVRPAAVFVSTIGSDVTLAGRIFLSWIAPRGVVAAAVISVFALRLEGTGLAGVDRLAPLMFKIIFATVSVYGVMVPILARRLGLSRSNPQGVLFGGAQRWVRELARLLRDNGFAVMLVDSNRENVISAQREGLSAHHGSLLSEELPEQLPMEEVGMFIALTPNDEVNSLAAIHFADVLGRARVYQLPPSGASGDVSRQDALPRHLRGRHAFAPYATHGYIESVIDRGGKLVCAQVGVSTERFREENGPLPLFLISGQGELRPITADDPTTAKPGDRLVSLVPASVRA